MGTNDSNECIFLSAQPKPNNKAWPGTSHSSDHPGPINLLSSPAKGATDPDDGVALGASGNTGDCDRASAGDVIEDEADQAVSHGQVLPTLTRSN